MNLPPSVLSGAAHRVAYGAPRPLVSTTPIDERLLDALPLPGGDAALLHARDWVPSGDELLFGWVGLGPFQPGELWIVSTSKLDRAALPLTGPPRALETLTVR